MESKEQNKQDECKNNNIDMAMLPFAFLYRMKGHEIFGGCTGSKITGLDDVDHFFERPTLTVDPRMTSDDQIKNPPSSVGDLLKGVARTTEELGFEPKTWNATLKVSTFKGLQSGIDKWKIESRDERVYTVVIQFKPKNIRQAVHKLAGQTGPTPDSFWDNNGGPVSTQFNTIL